MFCRFGSRKVGNAFTVPQLWQRKVVVRGVITAAFIGFSQTGQVGTVHAAGYCRNQHNTQLPEMDASNARDFSFWQNINAERHPCGKIGTLFLRAC